MADEQAPPVVVEGPRTPTRGAQVRLTGDAQEAARGGVGADIEANTIAKRAMEADGTVPDGYTPDGSTVTGDPPPDEVVTQEGEPGGEVPAKPSRVQSEPPAVPEAAAPSGPPKADAPQTTVQPAPSAKAKA